MSGCVPKTRLNVQDLICILQIVQNKLYESGSSQRLISLSLGTMVKMLRCGGFFKSIFGGVLIVYLDGFVFKFSRRGKVVIFFNRVAAIWGFFISIYLFDYFCWFLFEFLIV